MFGAICFLFPTASFGLQITEIHYDPLGSDDKREWVELYNETASPIDIKGWKLYESGSNHALTAVRGSLVINTGEYIIIADDAVTMIGEYAGTSVSVVDSAFSLSNSGETLEIRDASGATVVSAQYMPPAAGNSDGNSLHLSSGGWALKQSNPGGSPDSAALPVVVQANTGVASQSSAGSSTSTANQTQTASSGSTGTAYKTPIVQPFYTVSATTNPLQPIAQVPVQLDIKVVYTDEQKQKYEYTKGVIRIITGDGREIVRGDTSPVNIVYQYAGTYRIAVEYTTSALHQKPDALYGADIVVINPVVSLIKNDEIISLKNDQNSVVDISGWSLASGKEKVSIAKNTVLAPNAVIALPESLIYKIKDRERISLMLPDGKTIVSRIEKQKNQPAKQGSFVSAGADRVGVVNTVRNFSNKSVPEDDYIDSSGYIAMETGIMNTEELESVRGFSGFMQVVIAIVTIGALGAVYVSANKVLGENLGSKDMHELKRGRCAKEELDSAEDADSYEIKDWK